MNRTPEQIAPTATQTAAPARHGGRRLASAAAAAAMLLVSGCSFFRAETIEPPLARAAAPQDPQEEADAPAVANAPLSAPAAMPAAPGARAVASAADGFVNNQKVEPSLPPANVFGEFDGAGPRTTALAGSGAGFQQHTWLDEGYDADVSVSPDGKWLLFSSTRHSKHPDIYLQRTDGLSVVQLTQDPADDAFPTFSPDGKSIAFASNRNGSWDIYTCDLDGKNVLQVTSGPSHDIHPSFAPDGQRLVYCSAGSRSGQWELWTTNLASGEKRMIGFGLFPAWGPDKSRDVIAFQRARQRGSRWFSVWTLDLVDGEARRQTEVAVSANAALVNPSWSPDGKKLAFGTIVEPAKEGARGKPTGQQDVWTIHVDGTNRHRLTDGVGVNAGPVWSQDGRVYFVSDRGGAEAIWSVAAEGTNFSTAAVPKD
jgi:TolB protein